MFIINYNNVHNCVCFAFIAGISAGLFMPASPQTQEYCLALHVAAL
jgi:hypothetical protein